MLRLEDMNGALSLEMRVRWNVIKSSYLKATEHVKKQILIRNSGDML